MSKNSDGGLIRVKVRRNGKRDHEDFLLRPSRVVQLNGHSAMIAGRFGRDGSDKMIEVSEICFPDSESLWAFCDFVVGDARIPLDKPLFEMTRDEIQSHARREAQRRMQFRSALHSRHSATLKIAPELFPAGNRRAS